MGRVARVKSVTFAMAAFAAASPALAQQTDPLLKETITVAAGGAYIPSYVGSDDYILVPAIGARATVSGFDFVLQGTQASIDLIRERDPRAFNFQFGPVAGVNLSRTSRIKDPRVKALGKLDTAVELGGFVGIGKTGVITSAYDTLSGSVTYVHDVAGAHGSWQLTPAITYGTPLSRKAYVMLNASLDYVGAGYGNYYYSVSPAGSVASGLFPYNARKSGMLGWGATGLVNVSLTGDLTGGLSLVAGGGYYRVHGRFARSPIVADAGDRDQWYGGAGLAYTF